MDANDTTLAGLVERVRDAAARRAPLLIEGAGTKAFYGPGREAGKAGEAAETLDMRPLAGIVDYEPSELVVTARAGTPLETLEGALAGQGQALAFEPPRFAPGGTVGGMVAAGLSGPSRASAGALRDHVLGATLLNGRGEVLSFGGQVMKNVAGYDVSRLLAGSLGVLGAILQVSLKVLPQPPARLSLRFELAEAQALERLNRWAGRPLPISASAWHDGQLTVRLAGAQAAVHAAAEVLGGSALAPARADEYWHALRDHRHAWFRGAEESGEPLWRLSLPSAAAPLRLPGALLIEWGGAQRWLLGTAPARMIRERVRSAGGHATLFRNAPARESVFEPLPEPLLRIHRDLKRAFDPQQIFNRGRLFPLED